jgi:predicted homoserine dehydrogenase-like protein
MVALIRFKYIEECIRRHPTPLEVNEKRSLERLNRQALVGLCPFSSLFRSYHLIHLICGLCHWYSILGGQPL